MASRRYPARDTTQKIFYKEDSSSSEYEPSSPSDDELPTLKHRNPLPTNQTIKSSHAHQSNLTKSTTLPPPKGSASATHPPAAFFQAKLIPPTPTKPTPPRNPDICPHCRSVRTPCSSSPRSATTYICPNNCGWGHYDKNCGVGILCTPLHIVPEQPRACGAALKPTTTSGCGGRGCINGEEGFGGMGEEEGLEAEDDEG